MTTPDEPMQIDYIEFPAGDLAATKAFYGSAFGWTFKDYGDAYVEFRDGRLTGGFARTDERPRGEGTLVILRTDDLEAMRDRIVALGGRVVREIFSFPGGRRFHFADPSGNVLAVWSDR
jgi:predicted enzyme related to lactoylglutathione lyase